MADAPFKYGLRTSHNAKLCQTVLIELQENFLMFGIFVCSEHDVSTRHLHMRLKSDKKIRNLEAKKSALLRLRLMTTRIFLFIFLRDQNSQHFNEDLLAVNASAFSFVLCFKAIN